tara:strand:+ start:340 stop:462 length:123 start_codon:yes stop_codon:yes gene_type:complete
MKEKDKRWTFITIPAQWTSPSNLPGKVELSSWYSSSYAVA